MQSVGVLMSILFTPNMKLPVPSIGTIGPDFASDVNSSLQIVDQHNHAPGSGVPITPAGININAALTLNNNFLTAGAGLTFTAQNSTPSNNTVYESGVDLYYVDGNGNNVRITQSGSVAGASGTITGLPSGTASAAYVSLNSTFVFQSATSTAANIDGGSLLLRNLTPNSTNAVTLSPPAALGSNYTLTLPTIPGASSFLAIDTSGNMTATIATSQGITAANIASGTITTTQIASATILGSNIANTTIAGMNLINGTLTSAQLSASAGITSGQNATPTEWDAFTGGAISWTSGSRTIMQVASGFQPNATRPVMWSCGGTGSSGNSGAIIVASGVVVNFSVLCGLSTVSFVAIDNSGGTDAISVPISSLNGFKKTTNVGSNHTFTISGTIASGTNGVTVLDALVSVIQI